MDKPAFRSIATELAQLIDLKKEGHLTDQEFQMAKTNLLAERQSPKKRGRSLVDYVEIKEPPTKVVKLNVTITCDGCGDTFKSSQGRGSHQKTCSPFLALRKSPLTSFFQPSPTFQFDPNPTVKVTVKDKEKKDGRSVNKGSETRRRYTVEEKVRFSDFNQRLTLT